MKSKQNNQHKKAETSMGLQKQNKTVRIRSFGQQKEQKNKHTDSKSTYNMQRSQML
jgi:hypothetical protein